MKSLSTYSEKDKVYSYDINLLIAKFCDVHTHIEFLLQTIFIPDNLPIFRYHVTVP
jgi:hypothetical protein